jgi:hypothetical protein
MEYDLHRLSIPSYRKYGEPVSESTERLQDAVEQSAIREDVEAACEALWRAGYTAYEHSDPVMRRVIEIECFPPGETQTPARGKLRWRLSYRDGVKAADRGVDITRYLDGRVFRIVASPLLFDLGGRGLLTSAKRTRFDIEGRGRAASISELGEGVGLLVFDPRHTGRAGADGTELFGDKTSLRGGAPDGFADGFEALAGLVKLAVSERVLGREVLKRRRLDARDLRRLGKVYGLGMKLGGLHGKVVSLREAGVAAIALSDARSAMTPDFDGRGNGLSRREGALFVRTDGSLGEYADLWFAELAGKLDSGLPSGKVYGLPLGTAR